MYVKIVYVMYGETRTSIKNMYGETEDSTVKLQAFARDVSIEFALVFAYSR